MDERLQDESMKKILLIVGIMSIIACVLSLLLAVVFWFGYYQVLDGSVDLYIRLYQRRIICCGSGITFLVIGIVCMIVRSKI